MRSLRRNIGIAATSVALVGALAASTQAQTTTTTTTTTLPAVCDQFTTVEEANRWYRSAVAHNVRTEGYEVWEPRHGGFRRTTDVICATLPHQPGTVTRAAAAVEQRLILRGLSYCYHRSGGPDLWAEGGIATTTTLAQHHYLNRWAPVAELCPEVALTTTTPTTSAPTTTWTAPPPTPGGPPPGGGNHDGRP